METAVVRQMHVIDENAVGQRVLTGQQAGAGGAADGNAGHGMGEADALRGQAVEMWCLYLRVTGVSGVLHPPLVSEDIDNVGAFLGH